MYLEHRQTGLRESVKVGPRSGTVWELSSENLHPQQGENKDEEEEDNKQGINGRDGVDQRLDQVTHRSPVPRKRDQVVGGGHGIGGSRGRWRNLFLNFRAQTGFFSNFARKCFNRRHWYLFWAASAESKKPRRLKFRSARIFFSLKKTRWERKNCEWLFPLFLHLTRLGSSGNRDESRTTFEK